MPSPNPKLNQIKHNYYMTLVNSPFPFKFFKNTLNFSGNLVLDMIGYDDEMAAQNQNYFKTKPATPPTRTPAPPLPQSQPLIYRPLFRNFL